MATVGSRAHHTAEAVNELTQRSKASMVDRWRRTRGSLLVAAQAGLAAGIAWLVAQHVIGHPHPFFAPIAAVISPTFQAWSGWAARWVATSR